MAEKKNWHEQVADEIIRQIEAGTAPWQRAWAPGEGMDMPVNASTGKPYRGMNSLWLSMQGRTDPRWMTFNQAQALGTQVRRGEKSCMITYWKTHEERIERDSVTGEKITVRSELERPRSFHALVFNGEQIDGLPPLEPRKIEEWDAHRRAEAILAGSGANIRHAPQDKAAYMPGRDTIIMPERSQFPTPDGYYAVAFHELAHWTGHKSRLNRDLSGAFGSPKYAREELRAEIASMLTGRELGIGYTPKNTAAYAASWIKALEGDKMEIHRATRDAGKMSAYMLEFEHQNQQKQEKQAMETQWIIHDIAITEPGVGSYYDAHVSVTASRGDGPRNTYGEGMDRGGNLAIGPDGLSAGRPGASFFRQMAPDIEQAIQHARADIDHIDVIDSRPDPMSDSGGKIVDIRVGEVRVLGVHVSPDPDATDTRLEFLAGGRAAEIAGEIWNQLDRTSEAIAAQQATTGELAETPAMYQTLDIQQDFVGWHAECGGQVTPQLAGAVIGAAVVHMADQIGQTVPETIQSIATSSQAAVHFRWLIDQADVDLTFHGFQGSVSAHLDAFEAARDRVREAPAIAPTTPTPATRKQAEIEMD